MLRSPLEQLQRRRGDLADQVERAATSALLNIAEGAQRRGADRANRYRIAAGSAAEVGAGLDAAIALGHVDPAAAAAAARHFGQVVAMLRALVR